jgi:hypothetical protein
MNELTIMLVAVLILTFTALRLYGKLRNKQQFLEDMIKSRDYHEKRGNELSKQLSMTHKSLSEAIRKFDDEVVANGKLRRTIEAYKLLTKIDDSSPLVDGVRKAIVTPQRFRFEENFDRREMRNIKPDRDYGPLKEKAYRSLFAHLKEIIKFEVIEEKERPVVSVRTEFNFYQP